MEVEVHQVTLEMEDHQVTPELEVHQVTLKVEDHQVTLEVEEAAHWAHQEEEVQDHLDLKDFKVPKE